MPGDPILFDEVRINNGENYDPTTGIYTVPVNGFYEFHVQTYVNSDGSLNWAFYIDVDNTRVTDSAHIANGASEDNTSTTTTVILNLIQGQQVSVFPNSPVTLFGSHVDEDDRMNSWFSGRLIMAN